jgi:hypothetical protein
MSDGLDALGEGGGEDAGPADLGNRPLHSGLFSHARMVHALLSICQQPVLRSVQTLRMESLDAWERVSAELERRGLGLAWLADKMECSIQRVQNWTTRGIPKGAYGDVAAALGESIDWIAGRAPPKWRTAPPLPEFDADTLNFAAEYQRMSIEQRRALRNFYQVFGRPGTTPTPNPNEPELPGMSDFGALDQTPKRRRTDK